MGFWNALQSINVKETQISPIRARQEIERLRPHVGLDV